MSNDTSSAPAVKPGLVKDHPEIGKRYTELSTKHTFKVLAFERGFNFGGARGGRKDAWHLTREPDNQGVIVPADRFDREFEKAAETGD